MNFYLIGADYKSAKIEVREELLKARQEITKFWQSLGQPFTILSTCNRLEIYSDSEDAFSALRQRDSFYEKFPFWRNSYFLNGEVNIFRHALRLVSGLESQLKGETQIAEQIAFWVANNELPESFRGLWKKAYLESINIRNNSGLDKQERNIASFILEDLDRKYPGVNSEAVIAGTGSVAKLFARHKSKHAHLIFVSTKHRLRAKKLAEYCLGRVIAFDELLPELLAADFLVAATVSPHFILKKAGISEINLRRLRPLYIYDLALPRVVEPEIRGLKNIILQNLDDLTPLFERENLKIQKELEKAEALIEEAVKDYDKSIEIRDASEPFSIKAS